MKCRYFLLFIFSISSVVAGAQEHTDTSKKLSDKPHPLVKKEWSKVINEAFGTLTGSAGNSNIIGNYGSFAPLDGSFAFKGTAAIGKPDSAHVKTGHSTDMINKEDQ